MIVLINGAFGIGKTTVAREIVARTQSALFVDPEKIGIVFQRVLKMAGRHVDDFQDLSIWRRLIVAQIRLARVWSPDVVVPMAFSNPAYLDEIRSALARFEPRVVHVCLVAPVEVVRDRLAGRGADPIRHAWQFRRSEECCVAHRDERFAHRIDASDRTPDEIASEVIEYMKSGQASFRVKGNPS
jgi:broad-specificity NMP kinase